MASFYIFYLLTSSLLLHVSPCDTNSIHYLHDIESIDSNGYVQAVVEIPAGSCQKWEVNKKTGQIEWERVGADSLRVVDYLPYPANYGFIPQTMHSKKTGGDGDPMDLFILGEAAKRGEIIPCRVVAVIHMLDNGEQDNKLIAIAQSSHFHGVFHLEQLKELYPGVLEIITIWLKNYKGNTVQIDKIECIGDIKSFLGNIK